MLARLLPSGYSGSARNSPIDVYTKVSRIMPAQNAAAAKLAATANSDRATLSGLGHLRSALETFQAVAQALSGDGAYVSATSSDPDVLSANTTSASVGGSVAIEVRQLAQSQVLISKPLARPDSPIGDGSKAGIKFDFGVTTGKSFIPNPSTGTAAQVLINADNNTLQGIAAAINEAGIGVRAGVARDGTGYALSLGSPSGTAGSMRISVNGNPALQNLLGHNPSGVKNMRQTAVAQNALLTVNRATLSTASNTVSGVPAGTTLHLSATGASKLTVQQDPALLARNVDELLRTYNALNANLQTLPQRELKLDGSPAQIQKLLARSFHASDKQANALAKVGILPRTNGELVVDAARLQHAINTDPASVAKLITNGGLGIADTLVRQIQVLDGAGDGGRQEEGGAVFSRYAQ